MKTPVLDLRALMVCILLLSASSKFSLAQSESVAEWTATVGGHYIVHPDQQYGFQSNIALRLDVWELHDNERPLPTVIYIHGGGWLYGDRTGALPQLLPYFARGWNVVNVEYRMSGQSFAPAAVDDSVCALRWVYRNAKQFHFDLDRIIVSGHSAGGHLALMVGMFDPLSGFDKGCPADPAWGDVPLKVAAVVNWYGISDVNDLLAGPNRKTYAIAWLGDSKMLRPSPSKFLRSPMFVLDCRRSSLSTATTMTSYPTHNPCACTRLLPKSELRMSWSRFMAASMAGSATKRRWQLMTNFGSFWTRMWQG